MGHSGTTLASPTALPSTLTTIPQAASQAAYTIKPGPGDVVICNWHNVTIPPLISVTKAMNGNRGSPADQFTVQIKIGPSVVNATSNSTSTGAGSVITGGTGTTGATAVTAGTIYTLTEVMAAGSATGLAGYGGNISCSNSKSGSVTVLPGGTGQSFSITPNNSDNITCTLTNTAIAPTVNLSTALSGNRANNTDQFSVQLLNGVTVVNATTNSTSTGTGSTITGGKGTTGMTTLVPGTTYTLNEIMAAGSYAALTDYTGSISCTNSTTGSATVLPAGAGQSFSLTPLAGDVISCTLTNTQIAPTITLTKALGANRANNADQFTVQVLNGASVINSIANSTTTGSGNTVTGGKGTTGVTALVSGTSYTLNEIMTAGSIAVLADYTGNISCSNSAVGSPTILPNGNGQSFSLTPLAGDAITCTLTNTPIAPTVSLTKALGSARANSADQFTVQVLNGASVINATTNSTTTGSGSTVTGGKGTTGVTALVSGTTYTLNDVMAAGSYAALTDYTGSISCTNSTAGSPTVLPNGAGQSFSLTPLAGDVISCTLTNTQIAPTVTLIKALGGNRASNTDQFTVQVKNAGSVVNSLTASTTTGSGSSVTPGSGTSGSTGVLSGTTYTLTEVMVSGSTAALADYSGTISCSNNTSGSPTILPSGAGHSFSLTPLAGDVITCTITDTPIAPIVTLTKALGGNRGNNADQFTVQLLNGLTVVNSGSNSTTSGTGSNITGGTGTTGSTALVSGTTYTLNEFMAAGSVAALSNYTDSISCSNSSAGSPTTLPTGAGTGVQNSFTLTPLAGDVINCVLTNTPIAPSIILNTSLGSSRASNADQFTVQVLNGAATVNGTGNSTTTGSGSNITGGKGTTGITTLTSGTTYALNLIMASGSVTQLIDYGSTITCANSTTGSPTVLPAGSGTNFSLTPLAGDVIACTLTMAAIAPTITLSGAFATPRNNDADQLVVQIQNGATVINATSNSTTSGSGSSVTNGSGTTGSTALTAGTGYNLSELMAAGSFTALSGYTTSISCSNGTAGNGTPLPSGTGQSFSLTPQAGDAIRCLLSNSWVAPTLALSTSLVGNPGRINPSDQFQISVSSNTSAGNTSLPSTATATTSGSSSANAASINGFALVTDGTTTYTLTDSMTSGSVSPFNLYQSSIGCSVTNANGTTLTTGNPGSTLTGSATTLPSQASPLILTPSGSGASMQTGFTLKPAAGDVIVCTFTNKPIIPRLTVISNTMGGNGSTLFAPVNGNGNGWTQQTITTTAPNTPVSGTTQQLSLQATLTQIQETLPSGWTLTTASCQDNNAAYTGNPGGAVIGAINGTTLTIPAANVLAGADLHCTFTMTYSGNTISGKVIIDNGLGSGGIAHNGIQDGAETGHSGVTLTLGNCSGTTYGSTSTDSLGNFSFSAAGVSSGNVCIVKALTPGYEAVSSNTGNTAGTYTAATDTLRFTLSNNTNYSNIVLGETVQSSFSANGTQQVQANSAVAYSHSYTAGTSASISFGTSTTLTPSGQEWSTVLYLDSTCSGVLAAGDSLITGNMAVSAGQKICILVKISSPAGIGNGALNSTVITITETLTPTPTSGTIIHTLSNTDTTTVTSDQLTLTKQVRVLGTCPANASASLANPTAFTTSVQAQPGQMTQYLLTYSNNSTSPLTQIKLNDSTPAYTSYQNAFCITTPVSLAGCHLVAQPSPGGSGAVQFILTDVTSGAIGLAPGASGTVSFCTLVNP